MSAAEKPSHESERLQALHDYHILDTLPEQDYDDIVLLAGQICDTPIALISLVDQDRQWFKAKAGLAASETPRDVSFCAHAILTPRQLMMVPDATRDERFKENPLVTQSPHIRFYAGMPLVTPAGDALGTLCVIDRVPRQLSEDQIKALRALGRQVMAQMELRRRIVEKDKVEEALRQSEARARKLGLVASRTDNAVVITDSAGLIEWVNDGFERMTGYSLEEVHGHKPGSILQGPETSRQSSAYMRRRVREGQGCQVEILNYAKDRRAYWVAIDIQPIRDSSGTLTNFIAIERDITSQKETEQALREATALQEAMLNAANYAIFSTTNDGTFRTFNAAAEQMTGFTAHEAVDHLNVIALHDHDELTAHARDISKELGHVVTPGVASLFTKARTGLPEEREWTYVRKDGSRLPVMLSLSALRNERGSVAGFLGIAHDITERRNAEQRMLERQRFASLTAEVGVTLTHGQQLHDSLQSCAEILARHLGGVQARIWTMDARGQAFILRASSGKLEAQDDRFMQVPLGNSLIGRIGLHREPCISNRVAEDPQFDQEDWSSNHSVSAFAGWPLVVADKLVGVLAVWLDRPLSDYGEHALAALADTVALGIIRKVTENALLETDARLRRQNNTLIDLANQLEVAYENLPRVLETITEAAAHTLNVPRVSVWMFDAEQTYIQCSDLYELDANRHSSGAQITAADFPAYFAALRRSNAITADDANVDPRTREFCEPYLKPHGITSMLDAPIRSGGHVVGVLCHEQVGPARHWTGEEEAFARSLADLVSLAIEMRQHERAETELAKARDAALEATRAKSEFLANMSHEIRTPMNGIIGMTNVLRKSSLTQAQQEMVETIRQSGESLLTIINDILDLSKIEAGKLRFEMIDFDLRATVEEVVELLNERAAAKGLELALQIHHEVPCAVRGDPTRLRQVLLNLIGNAIKFTDRGEVVVDVALEDCTPSWQVTRFTIKDTGIGIPEEAQERLFDSFSQADGSTTRLHGGTGLGLAISKRLASMMHGDIGVSSQPGMGSQFWFTAELERQLHPASDTLPCPAFRGVRALVVDDHVTHRKILASQFKAWNVTPDEASNGPEALDKLQDQAGQGDPYNLILLDHQMPGMDGISLARQIRQDAGAGDCRLVLFSSLPMTEDLPGRELFDAFLTKPVRERRLLRFLRQHFEMEEPCPDLADEPAAAATTQAGQVPPNLRVLVAEDNPVNQRVALLNLNQLGVEADLVANGREVLQALDREPYDVIFMDCQMPMMDGYQATRQIRQRNDERSHVRIIAMTASAMEGDRERCLAAGMDDYVAKPIQLEDLQRALTGSGPAAPEPEPPEPSEPSGPVDLRVLARISNHQPEQLRDLVTMYLRSTACQLGDLQEAIEQGAPDKVRYVAHKIAGSSASCGVTDMAGTLRELESLARRGDLSQADELFNRARQCFREVGTFLENELQISHP